MGGLFETSNVNPEVSLSVSVSLYVSVLPSLSVPLHVFPTLAYINVSLHDVADTQERRIQQLQ